ncbi:MAG: hypothetical protein K2M31_06185 [Muribaculaceae bacterium]|nr:hypothetical protein [Muribaculaceae bacterium]
MKTNKTLGILLSICGIVFIFWFFMGIVPPEALSDKVRILDAIVVSAVFSLLTLSMMSPMVNLKDPSHKQVGGLGIKWSVLGIYSVAAIVTVIGCLGYSWAKHEDIISFPIQLALQLFYLFFLLSGLLAAKSSADYTESVYREERKLKQGKADLKSAMSGLLRAAEDTPGVERSVITRIRSLSDDCRYVTPSDSAEARDLDFEIENQCALIKPALYDPELNKDFIERNLTLLERNFERRRKAY